VNTYDHIQSRVFANDNDYDAFRGRVVAEYTVERVDKRRNCTIRTTYEVIDIGRPDPVSPVDPDAQMGPESLGTDRDSIRAAMEAVQENKAKRTAELLAQLADAFDRHGPMTAYDVGMRLGVAGARALAVLRAHRDRFEFFGGQSARWGNLGQTYTPTQMRRVSPTMRALRDALEQHGPQTARELSERVKISSQSSIIHVLVAQDDWFFMTGMRPANGKMPATRIWGLIGIHDQEDK